MAGGERASSLSYLSSFLSRSPRSGSFNRMKLWAEGVVLDETPGEVVCRILRRVSGFAIADSFACRSRGNIPR